jgi:hypothetical protein
MMPTQMGLYGHADRLKHSLWIDPAKQNPPWPPCRHVESFVKTRAVPPTPNDSVAANESLQPLPASKTREETIWKVYLAYVLTGYIDPTVGVYNCWAPEDERDLYAERAEHERRVKQEKEAEQRRQKWKLWFSWVRARPQL